jgi:hypothetical protein
MRRILNKRIKTGEGDDHESSSSDSVDTSNDSGVSGTYTSTSATTSSATRSIGDRMRSGQPSQQRSRAKGMIETISENAPLETTDTDILVPRKRNGVNRSKSMGAESSGSLPSRRKPSEDDKNKSSSKSKNTSSESKPKKSVRWNHRVEKKRHHRLQDLSNEEKEAVWYTENDSKLILAMAKVTVKMMMKGEPCDDIDYCSRGLEGKTPAGSKQRQKNKLKVRKALLEEQEIQRDEGIHDDEYLAQVSRTNSEEVCAQAREVAKRDEEAIRDYLSSAGLTQDISPIQPRRGNRR